jgi:hypothetical protein
MPSLTPGAPTGGGASWTRVLKWALLVLVVVALVLAWRHRFGEPESFDQMDDQFKYGSVGADHPMAQAPLPYWLWRALPDLFDPDEVIPKAHAHTNGKKGWEAFGLFIEPKLPSRNNLPSAVAFERPIGFSRRRVFGMDFVGLNCSFCHLGTLQREPGGRREAVLGGVGNAVDIEQYFLYLFAALKDPRFTGERVMAAVDRELARQNAELGAVQRFLYRWVIIPFLPVYVNGLEDRKFDFINPLNDRRLDDFGPGRVDTWGLYKRVFVDPPVHDHINGTADFPPLWNQKARTGMRLHWDGNTDVLLERNIVSVLSLIGKRIDYLDFAGLTRVTEWIEGLLPPRYADLVPASVTAGNPPIDAEKAARGAGVFNEQCARCHLPTGDRVGRVEPIDGGIDTDRLRFKEFIPELERALNKLGTDQWQLRNFRVQQGYVNGLLDGVWLRSPYLHNGSVPTLRDLLEPPDKRPAVFCRGGELYDWKNLGFVSAPTLVGGVPTCPGQFLYDTRLKDRGRGNGGHPYGTSLTDAQKDDLIEFLKTL